MRATERRETVCKPAEELRLQWTMLTVSMNGVLTEEANEECAQYMTSPRSLVDTQQNLVVGGITDTAELTITNFTW